MRLLGLGLSFAMTGAFVVAPARAMQVPPSALKVSASALRVQVKENAVAARIAFLLKQARRARALGHLVEPPGDNAAELYAEVLKLDPDNTEAKEAIVSLRHAIHATLAQAKVAPPELQRPDARAADVDLTTDLARYKSTATPQAEIASHPPLAPTTLPHGHPSRAPPPPAALSSVAASPIDLLIQRLPLANIAFNTPSNMRANEAQSIQLLLSGVATVDELRKQISAEGSLTSDRIKVSELLEAHLTGTSFKVEAVTPEAQAVGRTTTARWEWEVTPTREGAGKLHLTINALVQIDGQERRISIQTYDRTINVNVDWSGRLGGFFSANWQWLWTAILVPLALLTWRRFRRKGSDSK